MSKEIEELLKIPVSEWPRLWCTMNRWEFPEELKAIKPDWWDTAPGFRLPGEEGVEKYAFIKPLMAQIMNTVGHKACNREWNKDSMTDEEHEQFWNGLTHKERLPARLEDKNGTNETLLNN